MYDLETIYNKILDSMERYYLSEDRPIKADIKEYDLEYIKKYERLLIHTNYVNRDTEILISASLSFKDMQTLLKRFIELTDNNELIYNVKISFSLY